MTSTGHQFSSQHIAHLERRLTYLSTTVEEVVLDVSHHTVDTILGSSLLGSLTSPGKVRLKCPSPAVGFRDRIGVISPHYKEGTVSTTCSGGVPISRSLPLRNT